MKVMIYYRYIPLNLSIINLIEIYLIYHTKTNITTSKHGSPKIEKL